MDDSARPIRDYSAEESAKLAKDILRWAGPERAMWKFLYHALSTDRDNAKANFILHRFAQEFADIDACVLLFEYILTKELSELKDEIEKDHFCRLYHASLVKPKLAATPITIDMIKDRSLLVSDEKKLSALKAQAHAKGLDGPKVFDAILRGIGLKAGLVKHKIKIGEEFNLDERCHPELFEHTGEWDEFLDSTEVQLEYSTP